MREEDCLLLGERGGLFVAGRERRIVCCWVREEDCPLLGERGGLSVAG